MLSGAAVPRAFSRNGDVPVLGPEMIRRLFASGSGIRPVVRAHRIHAGAAEDAGAGRCRY
ncbi:hypothetical protein Aau02nite_64030 [Amorphoplanes auranticolor]|uniref:Uncharacterized protein n=1 Tax=Actinoplanes auranticolor TaxID=47988 RepID=A0A919SP05_9ACTN|nr:hypothetical protein Aau02nite_64030 [Actinoplanes auranticolor]